jgi:hypothetical protein
MGKGYNISGMFDILFWEITVRPNLIFKNDFNEYKFKANECIKWHINSIPVLKIKIKKLIECRKHLSTLTDLISFWLGWRIT